MRMGEHEVLFIIAIISTIKMTAGCQFKAAPHHSSLHWPAVVTPEHFALGNKFSSWQLLIKMHHPPLVLLFLISTEVSQECWGSVSSTRAVFALQWQHCKNGTCLLFCETVKRIISSASSVLVFCTFGKGENKNMLKHSVGFLLCFSVPSSSLLSLHGRNKVTAIWHLSWTLIMLSTASRTRILRGLY